MKKWLIALCCVLVAAAIAIVTILNNSNSRIDTLNQDLGNIQAEYNTLKEKNEKDEQTIQDLNHQVAELTTEKDRLTAENGQLNETLEGLNRNLSSSQQKLQGVMYILTDGAQGNIESILSPYIKIFGDVGVNSPYFDAVDYVNKHKLMAPMEEEVFGVAEKATLGEMAEGLYLIQGKTGTRAEAVTALLQAEKAWLAAQAPIEAAEPSAEEATEPATEEDAAPAAEDAAAPAAEAEAAPAAEDAAAPAAEAEAAPAAEEAAAPETEAEAAPAAEAAAAPETEAEATPAAEEATAPVTEAEAEPAAEDAAEPAAETKAEPAAEEAAEPAAEPVAEETAEEAIEDETLILTRERILSLCGAVCAEAGKELPEISFPAAGAEEATRGDLAIALAAMAE